MKACGLVVEYNPFHNGHLYHLRKAAEKSGADCTIAVMSGSFLQRGEPAIIDKIHRAKAALHSGVDIVIELPFPYAVQSSELFAKGALLSLHSIGASFVCFGSESGDISQFESGVDSLLHNETLFNRSIQVNLDMGHSYPKASNEAYKAIGIDQLDLFQPNNILGFSYVKTIVENNLPIQPITIKRIHNEYHDESISSKISSATSIRKEVMNHDITEKIIETLPQSSLFYFRQYNNLANQWHYWKQYFPYLHYKVMSMTHDELAAIQGVDEGLEYRIKRTATAATSFDDWLERIKTKRYTYVRLQRIFVHILTNTTKKDINRFVQSDHVPFIRLLGMSNTGQAFLNQQKKAIDVPIFTNLNRHNSKALFMDERATNIYYSVLSPKRRINLRKQEFKLPIII